MIEDIYKRLAYLGNNDQLPQDCICVPWSQIDSLPELLSDEAFELRAEKKVENDAIEDRFKQLESQYKEIVKILNELKGVVSGGADPRVLPSLVVPDARVNRLRSQECVEPSSPSKRKRFDESFPALEAHDQLVAVLGKQYAEAARQQHQNQRERSNTRLKAVSGTHIDKTGSGNRKMKVAPVDIFVYGAHKETTAEDIVVELKCSDIVISKEDIVEKTRENSNVKSFKISVKAEYLEKALKPETWPLRVKVREWVYYPKKREQQSDGGRMGQRGGAGAAVGQGQHLPIYKNTTTEGTAALGADGGQSAQ